MDVLLRSVTWRAKRTRIWSLVLTVMIWGLSAGIVRAAGVAKTSKDPYVRMHAKDAVEWQTWGPDAFRKAVEENKPIFLSVGFLSCLYCHIEEQEVFKNQKVAAFMNKHFVNVIVDRERRPQVDRIYQIAQRAMGKQVAWPNSMVLTPDRLPFAGGGYYPLHSNNPQRAGFRQMLEEASAQWGQHQARVKQDAERILREMRKQASRGAGGANADPDKWLTESLAHWRGRYDHRFGGFGSGDSKFPNAPVLAMLMDAGQKKNRGENPKALQHELLRSLNGMAFGALMDHVNGGFRRYSTDAHWNHPHREKMLYSNALLLLSYARAAETFHNRYYRLVALKTGDFMIHRLASRAGGFYNSLTPAIVGTSVKKSILSKKFIVNALGEKAAHGLFHVYKFIPVSNPSGEELFNGTVPGFLRLRIGKNIKGDSPPPSSLAKAVGHEQKTMRRLRKSLAAHSQRELVRVKVAATNGLAISALAEAGSALGVQKWVSESEDSGQWLWSHLFVRRGHSQRRLWHQISLGSPQGDGTLQDYANSGLAFLSLYRVTKHKVWLQRASQMAGQIRHTFQRKDGLLVSVANPKYLILDPVDFRDGQMASGTTQAIKFLWKLYGITGKSSDLVAARGALRAVAGRVSRAPGQWPALVTVAQEPGLVSK